MPPLVSARSAAVTSGPTEAKIIAASSFFGGISSEPPAHFAPSAFALCCVSMSRKHKKVSSFMKGDLRDQVGGVAKAIDAKPAHIPCFTIGAITNQACA